MPVCLLGLGVVAPAHQMQQSEALQMFRDIVCVEERQVRLAGALFRKAEVETRHTVLPHQVAYHWCEPSLADEATAAAINGSIPGPVPPAVVAGRSPGPSTGQRMELYARFAADLAVAAGQQALDSAQLPASAITHLVVVTCTGFYAPGVDLDLIQRLGLRNTTQRVQVGFMGCHGAINGLRTARAIAAADPEARVLLCAVELCSLHYRFTWDAEGVIGNALFADGAGAVVIGCGGGPPLRQESAGPPEESAGPAGVSAGQMADGVWQVVDTGSVVIADSRHAMSWTIGDHGFDMRLTSDVGDKIADQLAGWLVPWLAERRLQLEDIDYWGVHPGGPRILQAVQESLGLPPTALEVSRAILRRHGNMSSPTVLFILDEFRRRRCAAADRQPGHGVLLGFGPGLVAEIALLSVH